MITVRVSEDLQKAIKAVDGVGSRHIPRSTLIALTKTAGIAKTNVQAAMPTYLHNPTPYTIGSLWVKGANKATPSATVMIKDQSLGSVTGAGKRPQINYLAPEIYGGHRKRKGFEVKLISMGLMRASQYAVPTNAIAKDRYGNVSGALIKGMLAQLSANPQGRIAARGKKSEYFVVFDQRGKLSPGIYRRFRSAHGNGQAMMFVYSNKAPNYVRRLPFVQIIERTITKEFVDQFKAALSDAIAKYGR